jgi:hypothetical protein
MSAPLCSSHPASRCGRYIFWRNALAEGNHAMSAPTVEQALALYQQAYEQGQLSEAEGFLRQALTITRTQQGDGGLRRRS